MSPGEIAAILAAGAAAGAINTVVGSGSLITFPVLLAFGFQPLLANVSNNVGLVAGNVSGVVGYRADLGGQGRLLRSLGPVALAGALAGAGALLLLPARAFAVVVPVLIVIACGLVLAQPVVARKARERQDGTRRPSPVLAACAFAAGAYGGYFGAAQGVLVIGVLGLFLADSLQRINAAKNVLVMIANGTAAVVFIVFTHVAWLAVLLIAVSSALGGLVGARVGQRLHPMALRIFIVVVGVLSVIKLVFFPG